MTIIYFGSKEEAKSASLGEDFVMFGLSDSIREAYRAKDKEVLNTSVAEYHLVPFKILSPTGPEGSFTDIDEQAEQIGRYIAANLPKDKNVFVHCTYGEQRSPAVARAIAFANETDEFCSYSQRDIDPKDRNSVPRQDMMMSRTTCIIADSLHGRY